ncbi:MAG TPA: LysR family transcriptional regulator [Povalibacter sp.]|nr:LysR family transcriptional regulator [Povalibacter sp.]
MSASLPNLRHLHVVSETARLGSISAAARASHLSQPAVTQAVSALEKTFVARLFERTSVGMTPTPAGRACLLRIERMLSQIREAILEARRSRAGIGEPLSHAMSAAQLQALVAVVQHGGFSAAARALNVSRPTLHRAARDLERVVGTALFEKTSFGIGPTREAEQLARRLSLAFLEIDQARADVLALVGDHRGRTVIGAMPLARSLIVPNAVLAFAADYPHHTVSILDGPYDSMLDALRRGTADVLIGALRDPVPHADVVQEHLFDDPLAIVVRHGHPVARRRRASLHDLSRYPWIAPRAGSPLRRQFDDMFRSANEVVPAGLIECNSLVAARAMLLASDRVMLLSAHQVHHDLATRQLITLPHPSGRIVRAIGLTRRRDWHPTAAQESLLGKLRAAAATASQVAQA